MGGAQRQQVTLCPWEGACLARTPATRGLREWGAVLTCLSSSFRAWALGLALPPEQPPLPAFTSGGLSGPGDLRRLTEPSVYPLGGGRVAGHVPAELGHWALGTFHCLPAPGFGGAPSRPALERGGRSPSPHPAVYTL